ncbi:MAG TPA: Gfo/Idh/MocA family oxidoreductase, partial [Blastocatellia bacterium]|nr:Gfo/Idh/MocA family oxidoreductase [Blastocatellia bacterium]
MSQKNSRRDFMAKSAAGVALTAASWNNVLGANDRVRLGVIGTGNRGGDVMSWFLKESDCEVVALCDVYEKAMLEQKEKAGGKAKTYGDHRELLANKDVDAVLI